MRPACRIPSGVGVTPHSSSSSALFLCEQRRLTVSSRDAHWSIVSCGSSLPPKPFHLSVVSAQIAEGV